LQIKDEVMVPRTKQANQIDKVEANKAMHSDISYFQTI
jgi:hypothetical protein